MRIPKKHKDNASGFLGVYLHKPSNRWTCAVQVKGKRYHGRYFDTAVEAAEEYDRIALKYRGKRARLNYPFSGRKRRKGVSRE